MANLLEALQASGPAGTTSQLSTLLRAKTGKAVGGPATALSSQQERAAIAQTAQEMQPVQQAATVQQAQQEQQAREVAQRSQIGQAEVAQQRQANKLQNQIRTNQLLQELEQGKGKIDMSRYQASLEQIGQNLRLNNQQYVDNLQREGARSRLNDDLQFKEQLQASIFQDAKSLLEKQLGNKSILAANDREFEIAMERMGYENAVSLLNSQMRAEREAGMYAGIAGVAQAGISGYGAYAEAQEKKADRELLRSQSGKK